MLRRAILLALFLAGCSKGPEADLPSISSARSLAAEWALVNEQASAGHVSATYAATMRISVREHLQTTLSALTQPNSPYGEQIRTLLAEPADAPPDELRSHANVLKQIEDSLESD